MHPVAASESSPRKSNASSSSCLIVVTEPAAERSKLFYGTTTARPGSKRFSESIEICSECEGTTGTPNLITEM